MGNSQEPQIEVTENALGTETVKKPRRRKQPKIREFVLDQLRQCSQTKEQLAEKIIKSGLTSLTEIENVVRCLGVMFHKIKCDGINLKKCNVASKGRGRPKGLYSIEE